MKIPQTSVAFVSLAVLATQISCGNETPEVPGHQHFVIRDGQRLALWERVLETAGTSVEQTGRVVVFLHGATWSGRPDFDLGFDAGSYSLMQSFARHGWDTFCLDMQGYGESADPLGDNWCEATDAVEDLTAAVDYICDLRRITRVHLVGWSWGSQVAGLFAERWPDRVARLVEIGSRWRAREDSPPAPREKFRTNTRAGAKSDFVTDCFDPAAVEAYADAAIAADPVSPNGCIRDYFVNLPIQHPERICAPTMLVLGEQEVEHNLTDQVAFFEQLATTDKRIAVFPRCGHALILERPRNRVWAAMRAFLETR